MNKKIPTLKKIEKEFEEKFSFLYTGEATITPERVWAFSNSQEIKSFFRQQIEEILNYLEMEEPSIPPVVIGFSNHKVVGEVTEEQIEEFQQTTEAIGYKKAVKEINMKIKKIRGGIK